VAAVTKTTTMEKQVAVAAVTKTMMTTTTMQSQ
jgi:hypothetical protein